MLSNPHKGQLVRVWYRQSLRSTMPMHGRLCRVEIVCKGRPRNHGVACKYVRMGEPQTVAVPAGNLQRLHEHKNWMIHIRRVKGGYCASIIRHEHEVVYSNLPSEWRTVLGPQSDREACLDAARLAIDVQECSDRRPINPVPDARDRRRSLWWHKEARRRRGLAASEESYP